MIRVFIHHLLFEKLIRQKTEEIKAKLEEIGLTDISIKWELEEDKPEKGGEKDGKGSDNAQVEKAASG